MLSSHCQSPRELLYENIFTDLVMNIKKKELLQKLKARSQCYPPLYVVERCYIQTGIFNTSLIPYVYQPLPIDFPYEVTGYRGLDELYLFFNQDEDFLDWKMVKSSQ